MPIDPEAPITITAFDWVPPFARGQVRDLRVRWALEEVGQPYAVRYLTRGEQKQDDHRARQPFGQVPTYEEGDLTLFESGAIVLHIADRWPGLLPDGPDARSRAAEWVFAALNTVEPDLSDMAMATIFERDESWSKPRIPAIRERIGEKLRELSDRLGDSPWLDGEFSAGDLMMISVLRMVEGDDAFLIEAHPNLLAYRTRGEERPAFRRALSDHMAGFTGKAPPEFAAWEEGEKA